MLNSDNGTGASGRRVLALLVLVYILNLIDRTIISILATPIKAELAISDTQLGLLGGIAFMFFYSVMGVPIAWLADRKKRITIIAVSLSLWSGFTALCGMAQGFIQLLLCRAGVGIGEAGGTAPSYSLIGDYFPPEQRGRALGLFSMGAPIGISLGIFFGGWLASTFNWRIAFFVVGFAGLALVPILLMAIPEPMRGRFDTTSSTPTKSASFKETRKAFAAVPSFWLISMSAGFAAIPSAGLIFWLPIFFQRSYGLSLQEASWFYGSVMLIGGLTGSYLGGWLSDRLGKRTKAAYAIVPAVAYFLAAPVYIAAIYAPTLQITWMFFVVWQALAIMFIGPAVASVQQVFAPNMRATASASFLLINHIIGAGFGTFILGFLSDQMQVTHGQDALRTSMLYSLIGYGVACLLMGLAAMRLKRDWYEPNANIAVQSQ